MATSTDVMLVYLPVIFGQGKAYGLPPNGVFALGSMLKTNGISCEVLDASIKGLSLQEVVDHVSARRPGLVAISALTPHLNSLTALVAMLNSRGFKGRIICGGPHFNNTLQEFMETNDVDFIMYGEGELAFLEFVKRFFDKQSMETQGNLIHRLDGQIIQNPAMPTVENLDELPFADLSLGDPNDYETMYGKYARTTSLMASRGCPYLCTFCDVFSVWGRSVRFRSAGSVVDEMEYNKERFGIEEIVFKDSTFTLNYKWLDTVLSEMEKRNTQISWICNTRVDRVNREMLERMRDNGMRNITYGIESGNQDILDSLKKRITIEQTEEAMRITNELGILASAYFMVGNPGETPETAKQSLDLAMRIPATFVDVSVVIAFPGTETYDVAIEKGYLKDPKWYLHDRDMGGSFLTGEAEASGGNLDLPGFSPEEQYAFAKYFWCKIYLRPITFYRILLRRGSMRLFWRAMSFLPSFLKYVFSKPRKLAPNRTHHSKGEHIPVRPDADASAA